MMDRQARRERHLAERAALPVLMMMLTLSAGLGYLLCLDIAQGRVFW